MKGMLAALLLCGATLSTTMTPANAHDSDFPNQLRAINVCYTQWSTQHPGKAMIEAQLVACMKAQGFLFDPNRQIKGVGPCHGNKTATDHPDCYAEPPKTRASRTRPTVGAARVPGHLLRVGGALTDERPLFALLLSGATLSTSVAASPPRLGQWTDTPVMLPFRMDALILWGTPAPERLGAPDCFCRARDRNGPAAQQSR